MPAVRPLKPEEWPRFQAFYQELVAESSFLIHEADELACPSALPARDLGRSPILVAEEGAEWKGYLSFVRGCTRRTRHRGDLSMAVKRSSRRQGVGRSLLRALERWATENAITRLELSVLAVNAGAVRLYQGEGFKREGIKESALLIDGVYLDGYLMSKLLRGPAPIREINTPISLL